MTVTTPAMAQWPAWKKFIFRICFVYIMLYISPWTWVEKIPGLSFLTGWYNDLMDWMVEAANKYIFHVRPVLVMPNGSGDTSYNWTQLWLFILLAAVAAIIWSIADRKRPAYRELNYWLCLFVRYYVSLTAFYYGIIKLFAAQMPFPGYSQLATPLGDFLPMRLSWMFMGYSAPYQVFSGIMEILAGLLLFYRRTATLGVILAAGVFLNVLMLNLSYDIPVKLFAAHMFLLCIYLLVNEYQRMLYFFILHKPAPACELYQFTYSNKWMRRARLFSKAAFLFVVVGLGTYECWGYYQEDHNDPQPAPFVKGVYDVQTFAINSDTLPALQNDSIRWRDFIMDHSTGGSIGNTDTLFRVRYGRAYFQYKADTATRTMALSNKGDTIALFHYQLAANQIILTGTRAKDSLYVVLQKSKRHFQLAEKQFHWLSEYNR